MKKILIGCLAAAVVMPGAFAGSIDYLSNQSADYMRTYSRNASTDADAAFYNPAGTAFMKDGLSLQLNNQTIFKTYSDTFGGKEYKTTEPTPLLPSLWATYKKENLAGFIGFSAIGGGGQVQYKSGVPLMKLNETAVEAGVAEAYSVPVAAVNATFTDGSLYVNQYYPSMTLGGSYAISNAVSVSIGARAVYMIRKYTGEASYALTVGGTPASTKLEVDAEETALGVGGIVGVNIRPMDALNIGMRFETPVRLNAETKVHDGKGFGSAGKTLFDDGRHRRKDLPATIAGGLSYTLGGLTMTTSADVFLIGLSDQSKDVVTEQVYNDGYDDDYDSFGYEVSASLEYAIIPDFLSASVGYMYNKVGGNDNTYNDLDFSLDSHSVGTGAKVHFSENVAATIALARIMYVDGKSKTTTTEYSKDAWDIALGLDFRFN